MTVKYNIMFSISHKPFNVYTFANAHELLLFQNCNFSQYLNEFKNTTQFFTLVRILTR